MALLSIFVMLCFVTLRLCWCAGTAWHSGRTTKRTQKWATFYSSGTTPTFPRSTTTSMSRPSLNSRKQQVRTRSPAAESLKHRRDFNFSSFQVRSQKWFVDADIFTCVHSELLNHRLNCMQCSKVVWDGSTLVETWWISQFTCPVERRTVW